LPGAFSEHIVEEIEMLVAGVVCLIVLAVLYIQQRSDCSPEDPS
jgi:hypothetical protein